MSEENWIHERRSILLKEIVRQMLLTRIFFDDLYRDYQESGQLSFEQLDHWIGTETNRGSLWNLKENSHLLFRANSSTSFYERLFDWTLGSIFHEGMKLKENVYLIEVYQKEGELFIDSSAVPPDVDIQKLRDELQITTRRAKNSAAEEIENLHDFFSKAMEQLARLMIGYRHEGLLIRFLIENQETYERVYGPGSLKDLFSLMFKGGMDEAYLVAAKHYREGGWYGKALALLKKALEINPHNEELKAESEELERMLA